MLTYKSVFFCVQFSILTLMDKFEKTLTLKLRRHLLTHRLTP